MKRGLVFTLCALAVAAMGSATHAQSTVNISLNLRYTNPANPASGGTWQLLANTNSTLGIAGISAYIANINAGAVNVIGNGTTITAATLGSIANGGAAYNGTFGGVVNIVYGQDPTTAIVANVGRGNGTPGNLTTDPLLNPTWANSALIASGTFGGTRPVFQSPTGSANTTDANTLSTTTVGPTAAGLDANIGLLRVRGDSVRTLGLETDSTPGAPPAGLIPGDANRDGQVNIGGDGFIVVANIGLPNRTWDQGNFNNTAATPNGVVDIGGDGFILVANIGQPFDPPAISAVPEPASAALALVSLVGLMGLRRRLAC